MRVDWSAKIVSHELVKTYRARLASVDAKIEAMAKRQIEFNANSWRSLHAERDRLAQRIIDLTSD